MLFQQQDSTQSSNKMNKIQSSSSQQSFVLINQPASQIQIVGQPMNTAQVNKDNMKQYMDEIIDELLNILSILIKQNDIFYTIETLIQQTQINDKNQTPKQKLFQESLKNMTNELQQIKNEQSLMLASIEKILGIDLKSASQQVLFGSSRINFIETTQTKIQQLNQKSIEILDKLQNNPFPENSKVTQLKKYYESLLEEQKKLIKLQKRQL